MHMMSQPPRISNAKLPIRLECNEYSSRIVRAAVSLISSLIWAFAFQV